MWRMWLGLRAWWYQKFVKNEEWPTDVRRYVFLSAVKHLERAGDAMTPAKQAELAQEELYAVLYNKDESLDGMRSEFLVDGLERLAKIPTTHCARCSSPVFVHEAIKNGEKSYCKECGGTLKT